MKRYRKPSPETRFWSKIKKTKTCWVWNGTIRASNGYGCLSVNRRNVSVHRFSYELHRGKIPSGLQIDHLCRIRNCVNPEHLEAVPARINLLRGIGVCAQNFRKSKCLRGHDYDRFIVNGVSTHRHCQKCKNHTNALWKLRQDKELVRARQRVYSARFRAHHR